MATKPKPKLEPRICRFCGRQFQPRNRIHYCCDSKCGSRLSHNVKLDDSFKVLHCLYVGNEENPGNYRVTIRIHGYAINGFLYNERTTSLKWPSCFISYGPFWKSDKFRNHGLEIPSKRLRELIQKWLDARDPELERKRVEEDERRKAEEEAEDYRREYERRERYDVIVSRPISPCCQSICDRPEYLIATCRACGAAYNLPDKRMKWTQIDKRQTSQEQQAAYDAEMLEKQRHLEELRKRKQPEPETVTTQ